MAKMAKLLGYEGALSLTVLHKALVAYVADSKKSQAQAAVETKETSDTWEMYTRSREERDRLHAELKQERGYTETLQNQLKTLTERSEAHAQCLQRRMDDIRVLKAVSKELRDLLKEAVKRR